MKGARFVNLPLLALLTLSAAPLAAHRVVLPQPRVAGEGLDYQVVIQAGNQGKRPRRFEVFRVVPQPLGLPERQRLHAGTVPPFSNRTFTLTELDAFAGLLEVTGAPQILIRARLEIRENGVLIETVSLPAVTPDEDGGHGDLKHGGDFDLHLQGLARTEDGSVSTDLTIVNFAEDEDAECALSALDANGETLLAVPFLHAPPGAASISTDFFSVVTEIPPGGIHEAWLGVACAKPSFTLWAAVYRNGGRDVEIILPSGGLE